MSPSGNSTRPGRARADRPAVLAILMLVFGAAIVASLFTPAVWLVVLTDGLFVVAVLASAAGWGAWPAAWLGGTGRPRIRQFCLATALGLGILSVLALALGLSGALERLSAWALVAAGAAVGITRVYLGQSARAHTDDPSLAPRARGGAGGRTADAMAISRLPARWSTILQAAALATLCLPLGVAVYGATLPPGLLWSGEARGYDALEYHLQVPREYFQAGRIHFLPHNVYASFPQQTETLYLLLMHLAGDPWRAAIPAQLLHASLGVFTVVVLGAWAMPGWSRILVAVVIGSTPWLTYLACLAYVELGMLFFAAVAAGLLIEQLNGGRRHNWRVILTAGLCAGLAAGCKYTGIILVAAALALAWLAAMRGGLPKRLVHGTLFAAGVLVAFSPWLARNAALSGNPIYPFGYNSFGGAAWSAEQDEQWARGHRLPVQNARVANRARIFVDELFRSGMYGPVTWLVPLLASAVFLSRRNVLALLWLAIILAVWPSFTHMPGRFAVPILVPLALPLGTVSMSAGTTALGKLARVRRYAPAVLVLTAFVAGLINDAKLVRLLHRESQAWHRRTNVPLAWMSGKTDIMREANLINTVVRRSDAYVWVIGDAAVFYVMPRTHYTVVFNRDPWLEFAAKRADSPLKKCGAGLLTRLGTGQETGPTTGESLFQEAADPADCVAWLRTRSVTHVVFSWPEIERLRRTYGFAAIVTPGWVRQLAAAGLRRVYPVETVPVGEGAEVYEVLPE